MSFNSQLLKSDLKNFWRAFSRSIRGVVGETLLATLVFAIICLTCFLIVWIFVTYPWQAIPFTVGIILGRALIFLWKRYRA